MTLSIQRTVVAKAATLKIALLALVLGCLSVPAAMAGIVEGHTSNGSLFLTGSAQDDQILITQISANATTAVIRVSGRSGTTIRQTGSNGNGSPSVDFLFFNGSMHIDMRGGNDAVTMGELQNGTGNPVQPTAVLVKGELEMHLDTGLDTVSLMAVEVNGNVDITTGDDYDAVYIDNCLFHQDFRLDLGNDGDYARLQFTQIDGNALIDAIGTQEERYDQDLVDFYGVTVGGNLEVLTGAGVDGVEFTEGTVRGTLTIRTGDHRDHVVIEGLEARSLDVRLGNHDDVLEIVKSSIGTATLNGGGGKDKLFLLRNTIEELMGADEEGGFESVHEE
jgi:hypothetical protein